MNIKVKLSHWLANQKGLPEEIQCKVVSETDKAVKVEYITTATVWLPKSQIKKIEKKEEEN